METETLDKLYLEISQFTKARTERELRLLALLKEADAAINPQDRGGISLQDWNGRLKLLTAKIRREIEWDNE